MAMTSGVDPANSAASAHGEVREWPLRFISHNFGIAPYAVQECTVLYADRPHTSGPRPRLEDVHPNSLKAKTANHLMIRNFPPPAVVRWKSLDGTALEADVDIGEIFKEVREARAAEDAKRGGGRSGSGRGGPGGGRGPRSGGAGEGRGPRGPRKPRAASEGTSGDGGTAAAAPAPVAGDVVVVDPYSPAPVSLTRVMPHPDCPMCF